MFVLGKSFHKLIDFQKSALFILLQRSHRRRPEENEKAAGQPGLTTCHHRKRSAKRNGPDEGPEQVRAAALCENLESDRDIRGASGMEQVEL